MTTKIVRFDETVWVGGLEKTPIGPVSAAVTGRGLVRVDFTTPDRLGGDGAFDTQAQLSAWTIDPPVIGYAATKTVDSQTARIDITASAGQANGISLVHPAPVTSGTAYSLQFRARADHPTVVTVLLQKVTSPRGALSAYHVITLGTDWHDYLITLTATGTDPSAMLRVMVGQKVGGVYLDDVKLQAGAFPDVWRRDFQGGISLVNPTMTPVTVELGGTFRKILGTQAPNVNDGSLVSQVVLPPQDGIILLRPTVYSAITGVPQGWVNHDVTVTLTASDHNPDSSVSTFFGLNGPALTPYATPVPVTVEGTTVVSYFSSDSSGNVRPTQMATVRIDRTPPSLSLDSTGAYIGVATIHATATDSLSGLAHVDLKVDAGPWATCSQVTMSAAGAHTVYARAFDNAGNERDVSAALTVAPPLPVPTTTVHAKGQSSVKIKKPLKLTGAVLPTFAPGVVTIRKTRLVGKTWRGAGSVQVALVSGGFTYTFKPGAKGKWHFVAVYQGSVVGSFSYTPSQSGIKSVVVK